MSNEREAAAVGIPDLRQTLGLFYRLLLILRPFWRRLLWGFGISIAIGLVSLAVPYLSKLYFDEVYPSRNVSLLQVLVLGSAVLGVTVALMGAVRMYYDQVISARLHASTGLLFFNQVQHLEVKFFDARPVGEILSRAADLQRSIGFVTGAFQTFLVNGIYILLIPPVLFALDWRLAFLALATVPVTTLTSLLSGRIIRKLAKRQLELTADAGAFQLEAMSNIKTVKTLAAERAVYTRLKERAERVQEAQLRVNGVGTLLNLANSLIKAIGMTLFSWAAWTFVLNGTTTIGVFVAFSGYMGMLVGPVGRFAALFLGFQQSAVSMGRVFEYLDSAPEQPPERTPAQWNRLHALEGGIRFRDVAFGYAPDRMLVRNANFTIAAGSFTALVGTSGSGKSSLLRTLLRMYPVASGQILLEGRDITTIPLYDLRRTISAVWQEPGILRGTVRENLTLGAPAVSDSDLADALEVAQLSPVISGLPGGLDADIAEAGATLSAGQRQRLSIARALVRRAPVLLLDEATSHLDSTTEEALLSRLLAWRGGTTVVFATHRLQSIVRADAVFVLAGAKISGGERHEDVLLTSEAYREMWNVTSNTYVPRERRVDDVRPAPSRSLAP